MLEQFGEFLSVSECAPVLHCSEWGVRDMCRRGKLPNVKIGKRLLIPKKQLIEHIEANMTGCVL